jgi:putative ABC transport system ATP-binding protein
MRADSGRPPVAVGEVGVAGAVGDAAGTTQPVPLVEFHGLTKEFPAGTEKLQVLKGLDLTIRRGEFVMIMGKSGSGKTTLLNIIGMLDRASAGQFSFDGTAVEQMKETERCEVRNSKVGFVFQQFFLIDSLNVSQNVSLPMVFSGRVSSAEQRRCAQKYLDLVGLGEKARRRVTELSGGQQQRVAIARSLVNDPLLIMADEPTGALDTETGEAIMEILRRLNRQGKTVVMVTHDEDMTRYATRVVRMKDGVITGDAPGGSASVMSAATATDTPVTGAVGVGTCVDAGTYSPAVLSSHETEVCA